MASITDEEILKHLKRVLKKDGQVSVSWHMQELTGIPVKQIVTVQPHQTQYRRVRAKLLDSKKYVEVPNDKEDAGSNYPRIRRISLSFPEAHPVFFAILLSLFTAIISAAATAFFSSDKKEITELTGTLKKLKFQVDSMQRHQPLKPDSLVNHPTNTNQATKANKKAPID